MGAPENRNEGAAFEKEFEFQCELQRVYYKKEPLACKRLGGGALQLIKSDYDYKLIKEGVSVYVDCKSFNNSKISHSMLDTHQVIALHEIYNNGCNSGYVVYMRDINRVRFYSAELLWELRPRESLTAEQGLDLGVHENFSLKKLFAYKPKI